MPQLSPAKAPKAKALEDPSNRRSEGRFPVGIKASLCLLGELEGERADLGHAYVEDLSRNGLRLTTYTPVKPGEEVLIRFAAPGSGARTRRVAVRWVEEQSPGRYEVGLGTPQERAGPKKATDDAPLPEDPSRTRYTLKADFVDEPEEAAPAEVVPPAPATAARPAPPAPEAPAPQITHITVQGGRSPLENIAVLVLALAFLSSMGLLVLWQWMQLR